MKSCADCGQRPPLFKIKGRIKTDKEHSLCEACYRNQRNSVLSSKIGIERMNPLKQLSKRHNVIEELIKDGSVVFGGRDLPDPEDPSDPCFTAIIYISGTGAGTETLYEENIIATGIPSIRVAYWDKSNLQYLKHWLFKVLDDPKIYRANEIKIETSKNWLKNGN